MLSPLTTQDQVNPEWLTDALRGGGHLPTGCVTEFAFQTSDSPNATNARLQVKYSADATGAMPERLFLKLSGGEKSPFGDSEVVYYTRIAADMENPPVPFCYHTAYAKQTGRYHLLLEDLSETHCANWNIEPTLERAALVVDAMARLHAHWRDKKKLTEIVGELPNAETIARYVAPARAGLTPLLEETKDELSQEWRLLIERIFAEHPERMVRRAETGQHLTCIHADPNPGNILSPNNSAGSVFLIDRQLFEWSLSVWLGVSDLAYMMVHWWKPETRRALEKPLLERYHQSLQRLGVEDYPLEQIWQDYRLTAMQSLYVVATWCADPIERRDFKWVWHPQFHKTLTACIDLHCAELLGEKL